MSIRLDPLHSTWPTCLFDLIHYIHSTQSTLIFIQAHSTHAYYLTRSTLPSTLSANLIFHTSSSTKTNPCWTYRPKFVYIAPSYPLHLPRIYFAPSHLLYPTYCTLSIDLYPYHCPLNFIHTSLLNSFILHCSFHLPYLVLRIMCCLCYYLFTSNLIY